MPTRFIKHWRNSVFSTDQESIDDFITNFKNAGTMLRFWKKLGVQYDPLSSREGDYLTFYTDNPETAKLLGFESTDNSDVISSKNPVNDTSSESAEYSSSLNTSQTINNSSSIEQRAGISASPIGEIYSYAYCSGDLGFCWFCGGCEDDD